MAPLAGRVTQAASDGRRDVAGVCFVLAVVAIYLSPALKDGGVFGPLDIASHLSGLTAGLFGRVHNGLDGDLVTQMIPWYTLDWHAVHAGQFPLWNDYSVLGMPQFLNFESSTLSLPDLVGYLFPLRDAFLVVVAGKLTIAGTGTYLFARVVRIRPAGAAFAAVSFMLSGAFSAWIGWSMADVFAWAGYLAGFAVLTYRHPRRWRYVVLLAICCAFFVYGGFPEANILLGTGLAALFVAGGVAVIVRGQPISAAGAGRMACGLGAGAALSAPLWLPGIQLISLASRYREAGAGELPIHTSVLALVPGYSGLPLSGSLSFGATNYYETVSYVGIFAIVLALAALWSFRSRPLVVGLAAATVVTLAMTYEIGGFHPLVGLANDLGLGTTVLPRARAVTSFLVAVLAGLGLDGALLALETRRHRAIGARSEPASASILQRNRPVVESDVASSRRFAATLLAAALVVAAVVGYVAYRGATALQPAAEHRLRLASLLWPCVVTGAALVVAAVIYGATRSGLRRPTAALRGAVIVVLLGGQAIYLVGFGDDLNTYSHTFYGATSATRQLASLVGDGLVGLDAPGTTVRQFGGAGFYPNINIAYGVREFAVHDPLMPQEYFELPPVVVGSRLNLFDLDIDSAALARRYGVNFILAVGKTPPAGTTFVARIKSQSLYSVPGAAQFYFAHPPAGARVTSITHPGNYSFTVSLKTPSPTEVVLAVTALPGWHVTSDGRALPVQPYGGVMEEVSVPVGRQTLQVWYWPPRLTEGIDLAIAALVVLLFAPLVLLAVGSPRWPWRRSRRADD